MRFPESFLFAALKPLYRGLAKSAARKWIARLQRTRRPGGLDSGGLKAEWERSASPKRYLPLSDFEALLIEAKVLRHDRVYAKITEEET